MLNGIVLTSNSSKHVNCFYWMNLDFGRFELLFKVAYFKRIDEYFYIISHSRYSKILESL